MLPATRLATGKTSTATVKTGYKAEVTAFTLGWVDVEVMCADKLFMWVFAFPLEELGWF